MKFQSIIILHLLLILRLPFFTSPFLHILSTQLPRTLYSPHISSSNLFHSSMCKLYNSQLFVISFSEREDFIESITTIVILLFDQNMTIYDEFIHHHQGNNSINNPHIISCFPKGDDKFIVVYEVVDDQQTIVYSDMFSVVDERIIWSYNVTSGNMIGYQKDPDVVVVDEDNIFVTYVEKIKYATEDDLAIKGVLTDVKVMEFCSKGDLHHFLVNHKKENGGMFDLTEKIRILKEISAALSYLHKRNIIHRDLKPQNVLLTYQLESKIIDFGLSKIVERMSAKKTMRIGTSIYIAPEVTQGKNYSAYGLLNKASFSIEFKVASDPSFRPPVNTIQLPEDKNWLKELMVNCWQHDCESRKSFNDIFSLIQSKMKTT